ncbi:MAG: CinA family protein [Opitutus sp.]|nr:CinA family protein [Opitutus sp.]
MAHRLRDGERGAPAAAEARVDRAARARQRPLSGGAGAEMSVNLAELKALLLEPLPLTLAVAESMTCGRVQARIGEISGASEFFCGGITAYALEQKVALLGVDRGHATEVNCVSARVANEMACGVCRLLDADLAVATTGYAEPAPAMGVATPFAWIAVASRSGGIAGVRRTERVEFPGASRQVAQAQVADAALNALLAVLREWTGRGVR